MNKRAIIMGFLLVFCFSFQVYADPTKEPNLLVTPEIQKIIDDFIGGVNAQLEAELKAIEGMFPPLPNENKDARDAREAKIGRLQDAAKTAADVIKERARPILIAACVQIKCDAAKVKEITRAHSVEFEAILAAEKYMASMTDFINQARQNSKDIGVGLDKLNTGIRDGENSIIRFWTGWGNSDLQQAYSARTYASSIARKISEIEQSLAALQRDLDSLRSGIANGTLTARQAENKMTADEALVAGIEVRVADIIKLMQQPDLVAVIDKNAPEMNLAKKLQEAKKLLATIKEKIKESESEEVEKMKEELLRALAVPGVKPLDPLKPQLLVIPRQINPAPQLSVDPMESSATNNTPLPCPPKPPRVNPPPKNVLSWVGSYRPVIGSNGSVLYYELFDNGMPPKMILRTGPMGSAAVRGSTAGSSLYLYYATEADRAAGRPSVGEYIPTQK